MFSLDNYYKNIFSGITPEMFGVLAVEAFRYQYRNNKTYGDFCRFLNTDPSKIKNINDIPFLPAQFFKTHKVVTGEHDNFTIFTSSSTTGNIPSSHFVSDTSVYRDSFLKSFELFYGSPQDYTIIALLPSYLERGGSSLIYMVDELIKLSGKKDSGFFLNEFDKLIKLIEKLERKSEKYLLIGVSFALLDFAEKYQTKMKTGLIMETGGMKGNRKEITREELHSVIKKSFGVSSVHSEYGMTELLSQAYSGQNGQYFCPPWMKVLVRDAADPLTVRNSGTGAINVIDLANINSCCFIETGDLGKISENGSFWINGRFDSAEVRGCNLMNA